MEGVPPPEDVAALLGSIREGALAATASIICRYGMENRTNVSFALKTSLRAKVASSFLRTRKRIIAAER